LLFGGDGVGGELVPVIIPKAVAIVLIAMPLGTEIHTVLHDGKLKLYLKLDIAEHYLPAMKV
jgi:hypothetical protein